jgi:hypothetical protein
LWTPNVVELLRAWIVNDLGGYEQFAERQTRHFGSMNGVETMPEGDLDEDGTPNYLEHLTEQST